MTQQTQIDFARSEQLGLIRRWQPTRVAGVSAVAVKSALSQINQYGRGAACFASQARLAAECGLSERQFRRAVQALESLGLICVTRTGLGEGDRRTANRYAIVWTELATAVARQTAPRPADQSDISADQSDISADQPAISADQPDMGVLQHSLYTHLHSPTPSTPNEIRKIPSEWVGGCDVSISEQEAKVAKVLEDAGLARWKALAVEFSHIGVDRVTDAINTMKANQSKMKRPLVCLVRFLREGVWPVPDVVDPKARQAAQQAELERRRQQEREDLEHSQMSQQADKALEDTWAWVVDNLTQADILAIMPGDFERRLVRKHGLSAVIVRDLIMSTLDELYEGDPTRFEIRPLHRSGVAVEPQTTASPGESIGQQGRKASHARPSTASVTRRYRGGCGKIDRLGSL